MLFFGAVLESSAVSPLGLSSLTEKLSRDICFYTLWLGSACGLIKTVTECSSGKRHRQKWQIKRAGHTWTKTVSDSDFKPAIRVAV